MPLRHQSFFYFVLVLILICCYVYSIWISLLLIPFFIYLQKHLKRYDFVIMLILITLYFITIPSINKVSGDIISGNVLEVYDNKIIVNVEGDYLLVYGDFIDITENDFVTMRVSYFDINEESNDNGFNYKNYLLGQGIKTHAVCDEVIIHEIKFSLFTIFKNKFNSDSLIDSFAKIFLLGIKDEQMAVIYNDISMLSLVHIFALSGMHIHLLKKWMHNILKYIISPDLVEYVILFIIGIYVIVLPFNVSFIRAYLVMLFYAIFKKWLNKLDILALVGMIMLWINPYFVLNLSFIFSYFIYFIVLITNGLKLQTLYIYIASIPIVLCLQYQLNIFSFIFGIVLSPVVVVVYMGLLFYALLGQIVVPIVSLFIDILLLFIEVFLKISVFIPFSKPNIFFILVFYFYFFNYIMNLSVKKNKYLYLVKNLFLLLIFHIYSIYSPYTKVIMINVGQGDCFLIQQAYNKGNILIDTGGWIDGDVASDVVVPYLKSIGVFKLDYVFISHDDFDHCGGYESLKEQITISNTIDHTIELKYVIGDVRIDLLNIPKISDDKNDMSLVMDVDVAGIRYLFTGDIGVEVEQLIIELYPDLKTDILKVGHHGSNTSTSPEFLSLLDAKVALVSCGLNNMYGHPHATVMDNLYSYGIRVYRTDYDGTVVIKSILKEAYIYR